MNGRGDDACYGSARAISDTKNTRRSASGILRDLYAFRHLSENRVGAVQEKPASLRQLDFPFRPLKESQAKMRLEGLNLCGQSRLDNVQSQSGPPEMQILGQGDKIPEMSQLDQLGLYARHCPTHSSLSMIIRRE
jgi:hypothetical protein